MPRQFRKQKPYIVVFCEGESEQVYTVNDSSLAM